MSDMTAQAYRARAPKGTGLRRRAGGMTSVNALAKRRCVCFLIKFVVTEAS
jgi:hypothetical protein